MKKFDFLFLIFVIVILESINMVRAVGYSPSSFTFDLEKNQEECKMVTIDSKSEKINVSDSWAENSSVKWNISSFNTKAEEHEISINYDNNLSVNEREVEVCLSGNKLGEHHGVLLFEEKKNGSSIVQFGIWLKVVINEKPAPSSGGGSSGGGSGGGGGGGIITTKSNISANSTINNTNESGINFETLGSSAEAGTGGSEGTQENYTSKITGGTIWKNENARNLIIPGLIILAIAALVIYNKRRNNLRQKGLI